jgi:hypothetical protein
VLFRSELVPGVPAGVGIGADHFQDHVEHRKLPPEAGEGVFDKLRAEAPIHWDVEEKPNSGFWSVTRYQDIVKVLRDPDTFTSNHFTNLEEVDAEQEEARRASIQYRNHVELQEAMRQEGVKKMELEESIKDLVNPNIL